MTDPKHSLLDGFRLALFVWLLRLLINLIPKSEPELWQWIATMPNRPLEKKS